MAPTPSPLRVCMLSAEVRPYATVGGLSDVLAALPKALARQGVEVVVVAPLYRCVREGFPLRKVAELPPVQLGPSLLPATLWEDPEAAPVRHYFIQQEAFFDREGIYNDPSSGEGYGDNFERFNFFVLAALAALPLLPWQPQVVHCHDAHTALAPAYLRLGPFGTTFYQGLKTVLTIHNLAYQGLYPASKFTLTGFPPDLFYPTSPFEFYGQLNCLKAGICYSDLLNTVSPQYAREIQTPEYGQGLENVLAMRRRDLFGILNGIDTEVWDPERDPLLAANYSAADLSGKGVNKRALQELCGLPQRDVPLIGIISRLVEQKGFDLFFEVAPELLRLDCQWVVLGTGQRRFQDGFLHLSWQAPDRFSVHLRFDDRLAHLIEGGSDLFLMPSRFEPCGLNQMYSLRYGTIPVVRNVGGLADTVREFNPATGEGTGFKFQNYHPWEMLQALYRALKVREDTLRWKRLVQNAMAEDFSWDRSARHYLTLYREAISRERSFS